MTFDYREDILDHLTSHRQEPGPSRRIFFGNFQGRDFILEPSSDLNEINGAMLRVSPRFPSVCGLAENGVFGDVTLALSLPPIWFTLFFFY